MWLSFCHLIITQIYNYQQPFSIDNLLWITSRCWYDVVDVDVDVDDDEDEEEDEEEDDDDVDVLSQESLY